MLLVAEVGLYLFQKSLNSSMYHYCAISDEHKS
jgi:hypothetical protein